MVFLLTIPRRWAYVLGESMIGAGTVGRFEVYDTRQTASRCVFAIGLSGMRL